VETSDETLCERVARGDAPAFDTLVERYRERAYRLAWSMLRNAEDARDLSQEAFIRLYQTAGTFRGRARFSTWFYRILVNLCLDHRRRHRWWGRIMGSFPADDPDRPSVLDRQPAPGLTADEGLARSQTMSELWAAVDRLSPRQRAAVLLQMEDLPTAEIARVLSCSEATVRVHLHRALSALRKTLAEH
jgi:RNA polymerase sigma-70 factor, ECF subfamily